MPWPREVEHERTLACAAFSVVSVEASPNPQSHRINVTEKCFVGNEGEQRYRPMVFHNTDPFFLICFGYICFHHSYRETNDTMTFLIGLLGKCCFPSAPICRGRRSWNVSWSTLMKRQPFLNQTQELHGWLREKWVWVFVGHSSPVILVVLLWIHEQVVCQMCVSLKLRACTRDWNMFKAIW